MEKSLLQTVEKTLREDNRLWSNTLPPVLLKVKLINLLLEDDEDLLSLLIHNKAIESHFFKKVGQATVFQKERFIHLVTMNEFLPSSFTAFANKIGLAKNGTLLSKSDDIALVFPHKDCILEGGQSKEEQKREEIFYNTILAPDEVDRLKEPKVLTNAKRISKGGEEEFRDFNRDIEGRIRDNLIIKGNNLLALYSLLPQFRGRVKLIYIDPPYNTGGDTETFTYNNSFKHSTWLTFMKNRLEVSKGFLRDDGFIAIAIDHVELFYLGTLADEVFGRENRIGIVSIVHKPEGRNQEKYFGTSNEFMLVYAKNKNNATFEKVILDKEQRERYTLEDNRGKYRLKNFIRLTDGKYSLRENKPTHYYPIYVSGDLKNFSLERQTSYIELYPITENGTERTWKTKGNTFINLVENDDIIAKNEKGKIVLYEKLREDEVIKTHWIKKEYHAYHFGTKLLEDILGRKAFSFPKSIHTVMDTLKIMTSKDDIILDFHAGSGTTAHAVLALNKEDEGNRKFVLIEQLNEHIEVCNERIQKGNATRKYRQLFYLRRAFRVESKIH